MYVTTMPDVKPVSISIEGAYVIANKGIYTNLMICA